MSEWYYACDRKQQGPVSLDELKELAASDILRPQDLVWKEGMADWSKAGTIDDLFPARASGLVDDDKPSHRRDLDDDLDDDRPRRRRRHYADEDDSPRVRRRVEKTTSSALWWILGGVGAFVLLLVVTIVLIVTAARRQVAQFKGPVNPRFNRPMAPQPRNRAFAPVANGPATARALGTGDRQIIAELNNADPGDPQRPGCRHKVYTYPMTKGVEYVITLSSGEMDPYLCLEDPRGLRLMENDDVDPGVNLSSILNFRATETGNYRIIATTCDPGDMGKFDLRITAKSK